jgi:LCP family protein required for cell wall assembly
MSWIKFFLILSSTLIIISLITIITLDFLKQAPSRQIKLESFTNFLKNFTTSEFSITIFGLSKEKLSDSIMVVHFIPQKNALFLISIPRDLWISTDNYTAFKINEVIYRNKIPEIIRILEEITGLKMNGYSVIQLETVKEMIDYLGGVDIVLQEKAIDWVSGYTIGPGAVHLNGENAIWLIRNRYHREGDFFREKNQQQIVKNAFAKFINLNIEKKLSFLEKYLLTQKILQNININKTTIADIIFNTNLEKIKLYNIVLDSSTKLLLNTSIQSYTPSSTPISVLIPTEGQNQYNAIRNYIQTQIQQNINN